MKIGLFWGPAEPVFGGSLDSGSHFCIGAFGRNLASVNTKKSILINFNGSYYANIKYIRSLFSVSSQNKSRFTITLLFIHLLTV